MKKRPATEHHGCKNNETKYTDVANGLLPRPAVFFPTENMDIPGRTAVFSAFGGVQRVLQGTQGTAGDGAGAGITVEPRHTGSLQVPGIDMSVMIEKTKTNAGTRVLPMNDEVAKCFQTIIEEQEAPKIEKMIDGYSGFLFLDDDGMPLVAMHWEHRLNHMVNRYTWRLFSRVLNSSVLDMGSTLVLQCWNGIVVVLYLSRGTYEK